MEPYVPGFVLLGGFLFALLLWREYDLMSKIALGATGMALLLGAVDGLVGLPDSVIIPLMIALVVGGVDTMLFRQYERMKRPA